METTPSCLIREIGPGRRTGVVKGPLERRPLLGSRALKGSEAGGWRREARRGGGHRRNHLIELLQAFYERGLSTEPNKAPT